MLLELCFDTAIEEYKGRPSFAGLEVNEQMLQVDLFTY